MTRGVLYGSVHNKDLKKDYARRRGFSTRSRGSRVDTQCPFIDESTNVFSQRRQPLWSPCVVFPGRTRGAGLKDARVPRSRTAETTLTVPGGSDAPSFADDLIGLLGGLVDEGLVDVGDHTTAGDGRPDEGVELLVTTDGELKVAGVMRLTCYVLERDVTRQRLHRTRRRVVGFDALEGQMRLNATRLSAADAFETPIWLSPFQTAVTVGRRRARGRPGTRVGGVGGSDDAP